MAPKASECVKVVVRCRPLSSKEVSDGRQRLVEMDMKTGQVMVQNPKMPGEPPKTYTFDNVYDWETEQLPLYQETASPIVDSVLEGYNGTIFAYGQTGTGKTHTMEGKLEGDLKGIIPNAFDHVFRHITTSEDQEFLVRASFLEIYNEEIRDLLGKNPQSKLELKENVDSGVYVKDLTAFVVKGVSEITNVLKAGKKNRSVGATLMNQDSSRSHSIFSIVIESCDRGSADNHIRVGKLNLVDLAGSERQSKTGATGERLKEATRINLSLSALGNVISALVDGKSGHIPYRDSKLTRLLQDSLGGNTKTVMVANVGPADYNFDETMSTLRYANRAKNIKNKPRINEDPKDAMLREFQDEITRLKAQLTQNKESGGVVHVEKVVEKKLSEAEVEKMKQEIETELRDNVTDFLSPSKLDQIKREAEAKARGKIARINQEREREEAERRRLEREAQQRQEELQKGKEQVERERAEREALMKKIKMMESKLLHGEETGQSLVEETKQKEAEVLQKQKELEMNAMEKEETYASKQEEAEQKTKKLKKLFGKYQNIKSEIEDMGIEFQREKEELLDSIRLLSQQLKLKELVIDSFVPPEDAKKIEGRAVWDETTETWGLQKPQPEKPQAQAKRPMSAAGIRRPTSDYAKMATALGDHNPRFKSENILNLELDLPERTTFDYEGAVPNKNVQAAIDSVDSMTKNAELLISESKLSNLYLADDAGEKKKRPGSARRGSMTDMKYQRPSSAARVRSARRKSAM